MITNIKITYHASSRRTGGPVWVINMPGLGMRPRTFTDRDRALALVAKLTP